MIPFIIAGAVGFGIAKLLEKDTKQFAGGGGVDSDSYKKFGNDNAHLVNFDLSELDDFEEMHFNHFSKSSSKADSLQVLINTVEGDYSQLSPKLSEIAEAQYPMDEFDEDNRQYAYGGEAGIYNDEESLFKDAFVYFKNKLGVELSINDFIKTDSYETSDYYVLKETPQNKYKLKRILELINRDSSYDKWNSLQIITHNDYLFGQSKFGLSFYTAVFKNERISTTQNFMYFPEYINKYGEIKGGLKFAGGGETFTEKYIELQGGVDYYSVDYDDVNAQEFRDDIFDTLEEAKLKFDELCEKAKTFEDVPLDNVQLVEVYKSGEYKTLNSKMFYDFAKGGKAGEKSIKKPIRKKPQPKMVRQYFEDRPYSYAGGGAIGTNSKYEELYLKANNNIQGALELYAGELGIYNMFFGHKVDASKKSKVKKLQMYLEKKYSKYAGGGDVLPKYRVLFVDENGRELDEYFATLTQAKVRFNQYKKDKIETNIEKLIKEKDGNINYDSTEYSYTPDEDEEFAEGGSVNSTFITLGIDDLPQKYGVSEKWLDGKLKLINKPINNKTRNKLLSQLQERFMDDWENNLIGFAPNKKSIVWLEYDYDAQTGLEELSKDGDYVAKKGSKYEEFDNDIWDEYFSSIADDEDEEFAEGGSVSKGYMVFNYTDNLYATYDVFKTKKLANDFIKEFRNRYSKQGYYRDSQMNKIDIKDIDLLAIPSNFNPFKKGI